MKDGFSITADLESGIVRVVGGGFWSTVQILAHFAELESILRRIRARHGAVLALIDLREAAVQPNETELIINESTARIYLPQDRIAIVKTSVLVSLQMHRAVDNEKMCTFDTVDEAEKWLSEQVQPRAA